MKIGERREIPGIVMTGQIPRTQPGVLAASGPPDHGGARAGDRVGSRFGVEQGHTVVGRNIAGMDGEVGQQHQRTGGVIAGGLDKAGERPSIALCMARCQRRLSYGADQPAGCDIGGALLMVAIFRKRVHGAQDTPSTRAIEGAGRTAPSCPHVTADRLGDCLGLGAVTEHGDNLSVGRNQINERAVVH